jgi:hypothetical protein
VRAADRTRRRERKGLALIASAVALVLAATSTSAAARKSVKPAVKPLKLTPGSGYLALGDSVTFGFEESGVKPPPNHKNAASFVAYPEMLGRELRLKVANDLFLCQKETKDACLGKGEFQAALAKVKANVKTILSTIRNKAHYSGQLIVVNYYALNYASALIRGESAMLNAGIDSAARPFKVRFADGFGVWRAATAHSGGDSCVAGLLTQLGAGKCGVHPSYAGQALLAQAVLNATMV